jgi:hypothetical protein
MVEPEQQLFPALHAKWTGSRTTFQAFNRIKYYKAAFLHFDIDKGGILSQVPSPLRRE